jgi:RNA polymerase sigma-70 factor (ECF subfamily)
MAALRRREPRAMELIYDRYGRQAFGLAFRIMGDRPSAEDVVQEAFLTLWRQAERVDPSRGKLGSLLMTMVHHKAIDALRSRQGRTARQVSIDLADIEKTGADVTDRVFQSLNKDEVRKTLASIPEEQRRPIEMAYFEGLTHVEIAEALSLPLGTVKSRVRLGLEKMRAALMPRIEG